MKEKIQQMTKEIVYISGLIEVIDNYDTGNIYDLPRSIEVTTELILKLHNLRAKAIHIRNIQNNKLTNIINN